VLLVVNSGSDSSKTIANHYIEMRKIPAQNVLYLDWRGGPSAIKGDAFRSKILLPIVTAIEERKLNAQVDYIVYSSDFPWRIDLQTLFTDPKQNVPANQAGSLTGLTYLTPYVIGRVPGLVSTNVNWYVPALDSQNTVKCQQLANVPTRGFRSIYLWDEKGDRTLDPKVGQRYLLSTVLGITTGRGNTVDEILSYLKRAVLADGTRPTGTIYFLRNKNIRSTTRDACFPSVASQINQVGVRAVVDEGTIPQGKADVMGLMAGVENFDWDTSRSTILPGAICEHLTSYGGVMKADGYQTPLSEFLRHGAAGASGTIREPGAVQAKFPLPTLQLHYARGASLAEAFYQSVMGPYQLLIVGDPLCQPWAKFPTVTVDGIKQGQELRGSIALTPAGRSADGQPARVVDLYVDGKLMARIPNGTKVNVDTTKLADGYHEFRLVAIDRSPLETQGRILVSITVNNRGGALEAKLLSPPSVNSSGKFNLSFKQAGATAIVIRQNSRQLGRVQGEAGEIAIPAATLGRGPTSLQAFSEGPAPAASQPIQVTVQ